MSDRAKNRHRLIAALTALLCVSAFVEVGLAQIRAGSAFFKILPGTRQQNLAGGLTAGLDEPYSIYANPAATGFLREMQFAFSYSRWISDITNKSVLVGRQFRPRFPWGDKLNLALGLHHQGVDFESTGGRAASVNAQDYLVTASFGMPIIGRKQTLSLGGSVKYLRTELGQFSGHTFAFDAGLLYRTAKFRLNEGQNGYFGIFSLGASVNHLGSSIEFISESTPLPRTWRAGAAFNFGRHDGPQAQLLADYQKVRDEVGAFSVGAEIQNVLGFILPDSSRGARLLSLRGGYHFNSNRNTRILSKFTLGVSIRLDDYPSGLRARSRSRAITAFPPRNYAFRGDLGLYNSSTFSNVYQGSGSLFRLGPESFDFEPTAYHSLNINAMPDSLYWRRQEIKLSWRASVDPDLFDEVDYLLLLSDDSASVQTRLDEVLARGTGSPLEERVRRTVERERSDSESSVTFSYLGKKHFEANGLPADSLGKINGKVIQFMSPGQVLACPLPAQPDSGSYYWSVLAYDKNLHFRSIGRRGREVARFHVRRYPDLHIQITNTRWENNQYMADLVLADSNQTILPDSFEVKVDVMSSSASTILPRTSIYGPIYHSLKRGQTLTIPNISWDASFPEMEAEVNLGPNRLLETNYKNNVDVDTLQWHDLVVEKKAVVNPFTAHVHFDTGDWTLAPESTAELRRLSAAFNDTLLRHFYVQVNGHTDALGWRSLSRAEGAARNCELSVQRAQSVQAELVRAGAIESNRVSANGFGQTELLTKGVSAVDHRRNRRVEIRLLGQPCPQVVDPTTCARVARCDAINLVDSNQEFGWKITIENRAGFTARNFELHEEAPKGMQTFNYLPRPPDEIIPGDTTRLIWRFKKLEVGAEPLVVTYKAKMELPRAGASQVSSSSALVFATPGDVNETNNRDSDDIYLVGRARPQVGDVDHVVQCSETLYDIADRYYGDGKRYLEIFDANRDVLDDPNKIEVGQTLTVPSVPKERRNLEPPPAALEPPVASVIIVGPAEVGAKLAGGHSYEHPCLKEGQSRLRWYVGGRLAQENYGRGESVYRIRARDKGKVIRFEVTPVTRPPQRLSGKAVSHEVGPVVGLEPPVHRPQPRPTHDSNGAVDSNDRGLP